MLELSPPMGDDALNRLLALLLLALIAGILADEEVGVSVVGCNVSKPKGSAAADYRRYNTLNFETKKLSYLGSRCSVSREAKKIIIAEIS